MNLEARDAGVLSQGVKIGVSALNFGPVGRHAGRQFGPGGKRIINGPVTDLS